MLISIVNQVSPILLLVQAVSAASIAMLIVAGVKS